RIPPRVGARPLLAVAALSLFGLVLLFPASRPPPPVDWAAVASANNLGIGHLENRHYDEAVAAFEEVRRLAPGWPPGEVNLGLALYRASYPRRAVAHLGDVLVRVPLDSSLRALSHYILGMLYLEQGQDREAAHHMERVTAWAPHDPAGWAQLGVALGSQDPRRAAGGMERALQIDPRLGEALYGYSFSEYARKAHPERHHRALEAYATLEREGRVNRLRNVYTGQDLILQPVDRAPGPRQLSVGPLPLFRPDSKFKAVLAAGSRWALAEDFGKGDEADLRRRLRERFGAGVGVLDYGGDGGAGPFPPCAGG